jgi:hypothetical protein
MASWKKVIVSGSDAVLNQVNVGTFQVITSTSQLTTTKLTGSFTGSFAGDGTNITGITATGLNIPGTITEISNQPIVVSGSAALQKISLSDVLSQITGSGLTKPSGTATTIMVDTGSAYFISGSKSAIFTAGNFVDSSELDFVVTTGTSVTANINSGSIINSKLVNSSVTIGSTSIALGTTATSIAGLASLSSINITGSAISASGALTGNTITSATTISTTAGSITANNGNILAPSGYVRAGTPSPSGPGTIGAVEGQIGWFNTLSTTGDLTVTGNATVTGNLTVSGTASFQNSTNLLIADKFVLLASGSTSLTDGGIIVSYNAAGSGSAIFLEAGTAGSTGTYGRFAVAYDVVAGVSSVAANEYVVTATTAAGAPAANPTWGGSTTGYGNIYVNSSTQDIFIYS